MKHGEKSISERKANSLLADICRSVDHIAASRFVEGYAIGLTGNPDTRLKSYRSVAKGDPVSGFALLAWGMSRELALHIEEGVYKHIKGSKTMSATFSKCNERIIQGPYRPSANRKFLQHYLYIIW